MRVALIAGEGKLPHLVIDRVHAEGGKVCLLALRAITAPELVLRADEVVWLSLTQLGKAIRICQKRQITQLVMAGRVRHSNIFSLSTLRMGWTALRLWWNLPDRRADTILGAIGDLFACKGITLLPSSRFLGAHLAPEGILTVRTPTSTQQQDMDLGIRLAKELGRLDIGQTVVVKQGSIVALEALEGTDKCLERAGALAGSGCVVVKMAKPNQDLRFDLPVIGRNTLSRLIDMQASVLVIEAGKTLMVDEEFLALADEAGLAVVSCMFTGSGMPREVSTHSIHVVC